MVNRLKAGTYWLVCLGIMICLICRFTPFSWKPEAKTKEIDLVVSYPQTPLPYEFSYETVGKLANSIMILPGQSGSSEIALKITGFVWIWCKKCERGSSSIGLGFSDINVERASGNILDNEAEFKREIIDRAVEYLENQDHVVKEISFPREMSFVGRNILRDMIGFLSFSGGRKVPVNWNATEEDLNGSFLARYDLLDISDSAKVLAFKKTFEKYLNNEQKEKPIARFEPGSSVTFMLQRKNMEIKEISGRKNYSIHLNNKDLGITKTSFTLRLAENKKDSAMAAKLLAKKNDSQEQENLSGEASYARISEKIKKETLGTSTLEDLLNDLSRKEADKAAIYLKLRSLFQLYPEKINEVLPLFHQEEEQSPVVKGVVIALANTNTNAAEKALITLFDDLLQRKKDLLLLTGLAGLSKKPGEELEQKIKTLAKEASDQEVRQTAWLALGNIGRTIETMSPERYNVLSQEILTKTSQASDIKSLIESMQVLGNLGHLATLDLIKAKLEDESPIIRNTAINALRFVKGREVGKYFIEKFSKETDASVRTTIVEAMRYRQMTNEELRILHHAAINDKSERVRIAALNTLFSFLQDDPKINETLKIALHDRAPEIRRFAENALAAGR